MDYQLEIEMLKDRLKEVEETLSKTSNALDEFLFALKDNHLIPNEIRHAVNDAYSTFFPNNKTT